MKVRSKEAVRNYSHGSFSPRLFHERAERGIILVTCENIALSRPSIAHVIHVAPWCKAAASGHGRNRDGKRPAVVRTRRRGASWGQTPISPARGEIGV